MSWESGIFRTHDFRLLILNYLKLHKKTAGLTTAASDDDDLNAKALGLSRGEKVADTAQVLAFIIAFPNCATINQWVCCTVLSLSSFHTLESASLRAIKANRRLSLS